jgi:hypothetical protein
MGFMTSTIIFVVFLSLYVFVKESNDKNNNKAIIVGCTYYIQSLGPVSVTSLTQSEVSYITQDGCVHSVSIESFLLQIQAQNFLKINKNKLNNEDKVKSTSFYTNKGKIFDVYID